MSTHSFSWNFYRFEINSKKCSNQKLKKKNQLATSLLGIWFCYELQNFSIHFNLLQLILLRINELFVFFLQIILYVIKAKDFIHYFFEELYVTNKNYLLYRKGAVICKVCSTWVHALEMTAGKSRLKSSFQFGRKGALNSQSPYLYGHCNTEDTINIECNYPDRQTQLE